ncbi:MAG TPA: sigma-70 family RNA polymerase sigma factor [Candidatus Saccharicenans sp.]|jgi:RNA polymerase sigma-70 factor (ECF subfamily)|nr:sigma-70 family RNA polymerase sigma factor [Candidatus Saccharicenans sp.]HPU93383.1 sigma-70 family RNA polymerase sigma factor [Candidatus Saccharicenans sp.]
MKLDELYDRYGEKLYHYLTVKLASAEDAEDILQEVFLRLARYSIRWKFIKNEEPYVFRVARNEANRFLKRKHQNQINPENAPALARVINDSLVTDCPDPSDKESLSLALARLPEEQREVIVLRFFEELTLKEIAAVCGLSLNTVASRYRYGLSKLKSLLEAKDD